MKAIDIEYDEAKRAKTLEERDLDFADAAQLFAGVHYTRTDTRKVYGAARRIISMRYAHDDEAKAFGLD